MFLTLVQRIRTLFSTENKTHEHYPWQEEWSDFLIEKVDFYRRLSETDRKVFQQRVILFLQSTRVESQQLTVNDLDRLLVAASAIIPVWAFPNWHYFNLHTVILLPAAFNENFEVGTPNARCTGMVGTGRLEGKMLLSRPALYQGFENGRDKQNVGIHEFVHLIDMADGDCDGFPERLKEHAYAAPWFNFVAHKIKAIEKGKSNIRQYGATNRAEFFSVASEYFFERPKMLKTKHPQLFELLTDFYQQDMLAIQQDNKIRKKSPCPCGSGKRYKHCCFPSA